MPKRKLTATLDDMREMLPRFVCLEEGQNYFYAESYLFPSPGLCFRWGKEMPLDEPGRFHSPFDVNLDFDHVLRRLLSPKVKLDRCVLQTQFGQLLDERRDGQLLLHMTEPDVATHVVLHIQWAIGQPPVYETGLEDFARTYSAAANSRFQPGDPDEMGDDSYGRDVWLLDLSTLGEEYRASAVNYAEIKNKIIVSSWDEFDLCRDYYRQRLSEDVMALHSVGINLHFGEDFATINFSKKARRSLPETYACIKGFRVWYNDEYVSAIHELATGVQEAHTLMNMFGCGAFILGSF